MTEPNQELLTPGLMLVRRVAYSIARYMPDSVDVRDLIGAGHEGLLRAVKRYDAAKGLPFEAYATVRIRYAVLDELRATDDLTRYARSRANHVDAAIHQLRHELGHTPTESELATRTTKKDRATHQRVRGPVVPGDLPTNHFPAPDARLLSSEATRSLVDAVSLLSARQQRVLELYYWRDHSQRKIAKSLGVTESRVCQILAQITRQLRATLHHEGPAIERARLR